VDVATFGDGFRGLGPRPRWTTVYRWADVAGPPSGPLPPIPTYDCRRAAGPIVIDGRLDEPDWTAARWTEPFGAIVDGSPGGHGVRLALLWDEANLYAAWRVDDPDVRATSTVHHDQVYMTDDDVELFVDGGERYYELGINPIGTIYEFRWTWVEPLVERRDHAAIEALFKLPDFLYIVARPGERSGRVGDMGWELPGLRRAVRIDGSVNHPEDVDAGWCVEAALPWSGLREVLGDGAVPPRPGGVIRMQSFRAQHDRSDPAANARLDATWPGATPAEWFTWSAMGNTNVHNPERWVPVRFVADP
jgi:hypothetical protein